MSRNTKSFYQQQLHISIKCKVLLQMYNELIDLAHFMMEDYPLYSSTALFRITKYLKDCSYNMLNLYIPIKCLNLE